MMSRAFAAYRHASKAVAGLRHSSQQRKTALAFGAVALVAGASFRQRCVRCDDASDIRLLTYNLLAPRLAEPSHFHKTPPEDLEKDVRFGKILARLKEATAEGRVIALQEVDLEWAGRLHVFFAEHGYCAVFAQYGKQFNGYMGVMLAWPRASYEALDVEISRLADTAKKGVWPKGENGSISRFGFVTYKGLKEILRCSPPDFSDKSDEEWKLAGSRFNEAIFVRLRGRQPGCRSFCVGVYHMPCLFGSTEKMRAVNIHCQLLMKELSKFAAGDPIAMLGDFNIKPGTSPYELLASGGSLCEVTSKAEVGGLDRLKVDGPLPGGLRSAYKEFYGQEPLFTNFALAGSSSEPFVDTLDYIWFSNGLKVVNCKQLPGSRQEGNGPFPNKVEPSDHLPLHATLRLERAA